MVYHDVGTIFGFSGPDVDFFAPDVLYFRPESNSTVSRNSVERCSVLEFSLDLILGQACLVILNH